ncbi:uncharacterized protein LOC135642395 [Musa acuminata AAA Group]|uniref:uncharacterized protein LOC135642395 n=1 Tax=Musa acuminata AAA Group TaxID=214697 RepID=UPI0031DA15F0
MGGLLEGRPSDPLEARWAGLTRGTRVWADGEVAVAFVHGGLHPDMARELYTMPSDVLLGKSAKSLLWGQHYAMVLADRVRDAGRALGILCDRNAELRREIEEVRAGATSEAVAAAEQRSSELEAEVTCLKTEAVTVDQRFSALEAEVLRLKSEATMAEERHVGLQGALRATRTEAHLARNEAVSLTKRLEEALAEAKAASEAQAAEQILRPERDKKLIEDYKQSSGFQLGLVWLGQVTYEYGYRIDLGRFKARHPGLEVEADPFASLPEDRGVDMPDEVPFDDSVGGSSS